MSRLEFGSHKSLDTVKEKEDLKKSLDSIKEDSYSIRRLLDDIERQDRLDAQRDIWKKNYEKNKPLTDAQREAIYGIDQEWIRKNEIGELNSVKRDFYNSLNLQEEQQKANTSGLKAMPGGLDPDLQELYERIDNGDEKAIDELNNMKSSTKSSTITKSDVYKKTDDYLAKLQAFIDSHKMTKEEIEEKRQDLKNQAKTKYRAYSSFIDSLASSGKDLSDEEIENHITFWDDNPYEKLIEEEKKKVNYKDELEKHLERLKSLAEQEEAKELERKQKEQENKQNENSSSQQKTVDEVLNETEVPELLFDDDLKVMNHNQEEIHQQKKDAFLDVKAQMKEEAKNNHPEYADRIDALQLSEKEISDDDVLRFMFEGDNPYDAKIKEIINKEKLETLGEDLFNTKNKNLESQSTQRVVNVPQKDNLIQFKEYNKTTDDGLLDFPDFNSIKENESLLNNNEELDWNPETSKYFDDLMSKLNAGASKEKTVDEIMDSVEVTDIDFEDEKVKNNVISPDIKITDKPVKHLASYVDEIMNSVEVPDISFDDEKEQTQEAKETVKEESYVDKVMNSVEVPNISFDAEKNQREISEYEKKAEELIQAYEEFENEESYVDQIMNTEEVEDIDFEEETISDEIKQREEELLNKLDKTIKAFGIDDPTNDISSQTIDYTAVINELKANIDKKYNFILSSVDQLYNNEEVQEKGNEIKQEVQKVMSDKSEDLDDLQRKEQELNRIISTLSKVEIKADEIKQTDDFNIKQQGNQLYDLMNLQNKLTDTYGQYWFGKMSDLEKEEYIRLYMGAHNASREEVEKMIDDSIDKAFNQITSNNQKQEIVEYAQPKKGPSVQDNIETINDMNKYHLEDSYNKLQQAYSNLQHASSEQVDELGQLFKKLNQLDKFKPNNQDEEVQKFTELTMLFNRVDEINKELNKGMQR